MTTQQKTDYMRIALNIAGFNFTDQGVELIYRVYEGVMEKKGKYAIDDAVKIEWEIKEKYLKKEIEERVKKSKAKK